MNGVGMELGFVAVWRKIMDTAFYKTPNTCHFAVHCLIRANHEPTKVFMNGVVYELKQGEFISGRKALSSETGLTEQEIRTAIEHLTKCEFLTSKTTNRFTLFSITNYADYQSTLTSRLTKKQPRSNQGATKEQPQTNTNNTINTKTIHTEVLQFFNEACKKNLSLSEDRCLVVEKCLKAGRTVDQMKKAITNFSHDSWEDRHKYCDLIYAIGRQKGKPDNFEKWFNYGDPEAQKQSDEERFKQESLEKARKALNHE